jgi:hypothetical protein
LDEISPGGGFPLSLLLIDPGEGNPLSFLIVWMDRSNPRGERGDMPLLKALRIEIPSEIEV